MAELPFKLVQDMSGVLYGPQFFGAEETVYDAGEGNCDTLYFVESGRVQV